MKNFLLVIAGAVLFASGFYLSEWLHEDVPATVNAGEHLPGKTPEMPGIATTQSQAPDGGSTGNMKAIDDSQLEPEGVPKLQENGSHPVETAPPTASVTRQMEARRQSIPDAFDNETVDQNWAAETEYLVEEALNMQQYMNTFTINELSCKQTMCKLQVQKSLADSQQDQNLPEADWNYIINKSIREDLGVPMEIESMTFSVDPNLEGSTLIEVYLKKKEAE